MNNPIDDIFAASYIVHDSERTPFGENWCGPEKLTNGEDILIARYPKSPEDGDGQAVEIYLCAMPARFYTIKALEGPNSVGEIRPGYKISTGSSSDELDAWVVATAELIAEGMISVKT